MCVRAVPWATTISWFVWSRTLAASGDAGNPDGNATHDENRYGVPGIQEHKLGNVASGSGGDHAPQSSWPAQYMLLTPLTRPEPEPLGAGINPSPTHIGPERFRGQKPPKHKQSRWLSP